jgi:hypothetical protein
MEAPRSAALAVVTGFVAGLAAAAMAKAPAAPPVINPLVDPSVYPVAVWAMPARTAPAFAALGVNVFVGDEGNALKWCDSLATSRCMGFVQWRPHMSPQRRAAVAASRGFLGWMHDDEPDNPGVVDDVFMSYHIAPERLQADYDQMKASATPAPMYLNLGQGLANGINQSTPDSIYPAFCRAADVVCYDVYPTSTQENGTSRLHLVARGVDRLRRFAGPAKPVWVWLECTRIDGERSGVGNRCPLPHELRAQVWMAIVHGADGIGYFPHQFSPYRGGPPAIPDPIQAEMRRTNGLLHRLAPLLRTGEKRRLDVDSGSGLVSAALWRREAQALLVAVNMRDEAAWAAVQLPPQTPALLRLGGGRRGPDDAAGAHGATGDAGNGAAATSAGQRQLVLELAPYEVVVFATGIELGRSGYEYNGPATAPEPAEPAPPASALAPVGDLPAQADGDSIATWLRTHNTRVVVPELAEAPLLDGQLDDAAWSLATPLAPFADPAGRGWPALQTSGWAGRSDSTLYFAFRCDETRLDSLVTHYAAQWRNDCVEVWFDPDNRRTSFAHIIVSAAGAVQTERTVQDEWGEGHRDDAWRPRLGCRTGRAANAWTVELAVPLADLGILGPGALVGFDAARERQPGGGEVSAWTTGGFNAARYFGEVLLSSSPVSLAGGALYNRSAGPVSALVEVVVSGPRLADSYATWNDKFADLGRDTLAVQVPAAARGLSGQTAVLAADLLRRVPSGGRVSLRLLGSEPAQQEEFLVNRTKATD